MGVDRFGFYPVSRLCRGPLRGLFEALVSYAQGLARRKLRHQRAHRAAALPQLLHARSQRCHRWIPHMRAVTEPVPKPSASAPMLAKTDTIATIVKDWLSQFEEALAAPGQARLKALFHAESYWRDVLALTWHLQTVSGSDAISRELAM